ncbi:MAG TPA: PIN domain-containing protein [Pirellulales bacterium]|jgi:predicted nucleic acid-binding protein|nr:PIN domain-containing protein [Pirellulales bacterium]
MTPLLDINTVLDVLLVRHPWFTDAAQVWDAHRNGQISAVVAAFTVPTVFYIVRRQRNLADAHDAVRICLATLDVIPIQRSTLELARTLSGNDYEDNVQIACAIESQRDSIVTRNPNDFAGAPMPVLTPAELVVRLGQQKP